MAAKPPTWMCSAQAHTWDSEPWQPYKMGEPATITTVKVPATSSADLAICVFVQRTLRSKTAQAAVTLSQPSALERHANVDLFHDGAPSNKPYRNKPSNNDLVETHVSDGTSSLSDELGEVFRFFLLNHTDV